MHHRAAALLAGLFSSTTLTPVARAIDLSFDYTSFESTFGQAQFDVLNYPSINGRHMMTSTDNHRPEMVANGNALAQFYNNFLADYNTQARNNAINAAAEADAIHQYTTNHSTNNGPRPEWLVLNEISSSLWSANPGGPSQSTYRTWLIDCVTRLTQHYGYKVVTLAPFQNPGQNNASWQALSAIPNNYIGIECYLSGTEVWNSGSDNASRLAWAQQQYQQSKNSYIARGVPASKLFLTEHFANNNATFTDAQGNVLQTGWGRAGLASAADWDTAIQIRQDAIYNVGFDGFLAYNWGGNAMGVTQAEQIQHEYYYRSRLVLPGQQPQWLSDAAINVNGTVIPLSWGEPLNWVGGVPNAPGAVANFYRTNTAARTVTLDGTRTAGTLTLNSPSSYTIAPGTGGAIVLDATSGNASVAVSQGAHAISAGVQLQDSADVMISSGAALTISGQISGAGSLAKHGPGTLALTNPANNYIGITTIAGGVITVTADTCLGAVPATFTSNAITLDGGGTWRNVGSSAVTIPASRGITVLAGGGTLDFSSSSGVPALGAKITGVGTLTKMGVKTLGVTSDSSATFSGNWLVKQGRLNANADGTVNALGTGSITLAPGNGDVAQLGIGLSTGGIEAELANPIMLNPAGNGQVGFEVNAGNVLTLSGNISGAAALQKSGGSSSGTQGGNPLVTTGTLILTGDNTYTGGTIVNAGTLKVRRMHENNAVNIAAGAKLQVLDSAPTLPNHPSGDNAFVSRPSSLTIAAGGTLDLGNNDLVLDYAGTSPAAATEDLIALGFNGGGWDGTGIVSSTAAANPSFVLAVADNAVMLSPFGNGITGPLFSGQAVDETTVLVKFTHRVDLDLDGRVTGNDAAIFNAFFNEGQPAMWQFGDLDYDGVYTGNDASIFNGFYNEALASVPEPAAAGGLMMFAAMVMMRRRRGPLSHAG